MHAEAGPSTLRALGAAPALAAARAGLLAAALLLAEGFPASALAAKVWAGDGCVVNSSILCSTRVLVRAFPGERNLVEVSGDPNTEYVVRDAGGAPLVADRGCIQVRQDEARCPVTNPGGYEPGIGSMQSEAEVFAGDLDDTVLTTSGGSIRGEEGNDTLISAGIGWSAYGFTTELFGGPGNDTLEGGAEQEWLQGEQGNDALSGNGDKDRLGGGGGAGVLLGGPGDDILDGGVGNDLLLGAAGTDVFDAGPGDDALQALDGHAETVRCGRGLHDLAVADSRDRLIACDRRAPAVPPFPGPENPYVMRVTSHGEEVRATAGRRHYLESGQLSLVKQRSPYRLRGRLRVHPRGSMRVALGVTDAVELTWRFRSRHGSALSPPRPVRPVVASRRISDVELPRRIPGAADRVELAVDYSAESCIVFEVGIRAHRHGSRARGGPSSLRRVAGREARNPARRGFCHLKE